MKLYLLILTFFFSGILTIVPLSSRAQQKPMPIDSAALFNPVVDDITSRLPSVEALIDSAIANSPYLQVSLDQVTIGRYNLQNEKANILSGIAAVGSVNYGYNDVYSESETTTSDRVASLGLSEAFRYSFGATMRISVYDLLQRKNNIKLAKKELEQDINNRTILLYELRKDVMIQYNNLLLQQKLLKIWNDNYQTGQMQVDLAEIEFINGRASLEDMSRMTDRMVRAQAAFETQKTAFLNAYRTLEHTVGMKFNIINELKY